MGRNSILAALLVENAERCDPPLGEAEVGAIADSVARYAPAEAGALPCRPRRAGHVTLSCELEV
jgi:hypothetical protein